MVVELSQLSVVTHGKCECPLEVLVRSVCVIGQKQSQTTSTSDLSVHDDYFEGGHVTT